jgi:hypothetical protein
MTGTLRASNFQIISQKDKWTQLSIGVVTEVSINLIFYFLKDSERYINMENNY